MTTLPPLAVLGAGTMAAAVLGGLLAAEEIELTTVRTTNRTERAAAGWADTPPVEPLSTATNPEANRQAVRGAGVVLIGVKPNQVLDLLREVGPDLHPDALVISLAAGITNAAMADVLPAGVGIVRTAPNIASLVGSGMTALSAAAGTTSDQRAMAETIFATVGQVLFVPEDQLHTIAAISGSGPAYLYFLLERLTESAIHHGLPLDAAERLVRGTFVGAAELLRVTGHAPAELRRQVTSPNGSTERAVAVLADADLTAVFDATIDAAIARTREMGT